MTQEALNLPCLEPYGSPHICFCNLCLYVFFFFEENVFLCFSFENYFLMLFCILFIYTFRINVNLMFIRLDGTCTHLNNT